MMHDRCRLILIANPASATPNQLEELAGTGHVACCIIHGGETPEKEFLSFATQAVEACHSHDVPVLIADDTQIMGRSGADGLYLEKTRNDLDQMLEQFAPEKMVGAGGYKKKHSAMEAGEANPDFILIGRIGGDIRPEAHPKNIQMASWWSEIIDIPCVLLAGNSLESLIECAKAGSEFIAVDQAIWSGSNSALKNLEAAEKLLEEHAPILEEADA